MGEKRQRQAPPPPPARKKRAPRRAARRTPLLLRPFAWLFRTLFRLAFIGGLVAALALAGVVAWFAASMPPVSALVDARAKGSVTLLDRDGQVFAWRGEQFGGQVTADTVSPYLADAIIATEDRRFRRHVGLDPQGIAGAIRINLREGRGPFSGNGGSTLTQQTAKLLCLGVAYDPTGPMTEAEYEDDCRRTTLGRKVKEAVYALALELRYTKDEILTIYLNRVYLGAGARGFEAAAQRYFGKSANEVSPAEAAMLAGLLKAPTRYAPTADLRRSQERASLIVGLMSEQGYLTPAEAQQAQAHPAQLSAAAEKRAGGYFADWVMDQGPAFLTRETTEDVIVRTTFDQRIQDAAESGLSAVLDAKLKPGSKAQAAVVVMSSDGAVRAMVGGRRFKGVAGQFNRAIQAKRQTGSSFKPFVYAAALDQGYSPYDVVRDEPLTISIPGSGPWTPDNYDHRFRGPVTLAQALAQSLNIPTIRISEAVGRDAVRKVASDFGIQSDLAAGPALALGVSESTLLEMTGAYAGILNGGTAVVPYGMQELRLKNDKAPIIGQEGGLGERVISDHAARQLVWMMRQVVQSGTGTRAGLPDHEIAGKTGTTQAARDAWFVGFSADYVVGVWMGYDDNTPLSGVTGGGLPAEVFHEVMARVLQGLPSKPLPLEVPVAPQQTVSASDGTPWGGVGVDTEQGVFGQNRNNEGGFAGQRRQVQEPRREQPNELERALIGVLNGLFGN